MILNMSKVNLTSRKEVASSGNNSRLKSLVEVLQTRPLAGFKLVGGCAYQAINMKGELVVGDVAHNVRIATMAKSYLHCREKLNNETITLIGRQQPAHDAFEQGGIERELYEESMGILQHIAVHCSEEAYLTNHCYYITPGLVRFVVGHDPVLFAIAKMQLSFDLDEIRCQDDLTNLNNFYGRFQELSKLIGCTETSLFKTLASKPNRVLLRQLDIIVECRGEKVRVELCGNTRDMRRSGCIVPAGCRVIGKPGSYELDGFSD